MAETSITIPNIRYVVDSGNPKPTPNLIPIAIAIPNQAVARQSSAHVLIVKNYTSTGG